MTDAERMKQGLAGVFDRAAPTYDTHGPPFFAMFGRRLVELARIPAGSHVLDIATGRGAVLFPAAEQVGPEGSVTGIDLSEAMVRRTADDIQQRGIQHANTRQMDAERLAFADASVDYVLCGFALFFFPNPEQALAKYWRALKPGGRLGLTTWGGEDERWQWFNDLLKAYMPPQEQPPQNDSAPPKPALNQQAGLETVLQQAGFTDIQIVAEATTLAYPTEETWWATLWSHGVRGYLEQIEPAAREQLKAEAFAHLQTIKQADGFPYRFSVLYSFGAKPLS
jgi:ubiquinone/menaquinone biosynthesis C-methylase UbiE